MRVACHHESSGHVLYVLQARAATKDAADARKQGYLKAALDGAMSQASKVLLGASWLICWQGLRVHLHLSQHQQ